MTKGRETKMSGNTDKPNDRVTRFVAGEISKCYLNKMRKFHSKSGKDWEAYTLHINGYFEDTRDQVDAYYQSRYPVAVFEGGEDPIDPAETDGLKFKGRVMLTQAQGDRGPIFYLQAVSIEQRLGEDESVNTIKGNPFMDNPLQPFSH